MSVLANPSCLQQGENELNSEGYCLKQKTIIHLKNTVSSRSFESRLCASHLKLKVELIYEKGAQVG